MPPVDVDGSVLLPGRPPEPRRPVDPHVARPVHRDPVHGARARRRRLEAVGVGDDLVGHVAAAAPAHLGHPVAVHDPEFDQVVHAGHHVEVRLAVIVAHHVAEDLVAVTGAPPVVGLEHRPAARGQHLHVAAPAPETELVGGRRPAVGLDDERIALPLLVVERVIEEPLHFRAVVTLPADRLLDR